jgi:TRAP transporter TAXI family solute receptor
MNASLRRTLLATLAATCFSIPAHAAEFLNVLTGGTSGVYYPLGVALSQIYGKALPAAKVSVQATKASAENLNLLQAARGEVAFTLGDSLSDAWKGDEEAGFKVPLKKLRGVAAIYPNYIQIVANADSGIKTLADLKGKRVAVGAPKSGTELNARAIFKGAGMSYKDFGKVEYLPFGESVELMKNRQLDATLISAGLGVAAIRDLATGVQITIVNIPASVTKQIGDPAYQPAVIPAKTYEGQGSEITTIKIQNFLVTHEGVPVDTVYKMTRSMFENLDLLAAAHAAAKTINRADATHDMPIPLHPGAEKYYREVGLIK